MFLSSYMLYVILRSAIPKSLSDFDNKLNYSKFVYWSYTFWYNNFVSMKAAFSCCIAQSLI